MGWQALGRTRAGGAGSRSGARAGPAQSGPAHPRCPRRASAGAPRRAVTSAAPRAASPPARLPATRRVRALRLPRASGSDCCRRSEAARAQGALQASGAALGAAVLAREWACRQRAAQKQMG